MKQYHEHAQWIDCAGEDKDSCDKCGWVEKWETDCILCEKTFLTDTYRDYCPECSYNTLQVHKIPKH